MPCSGAVGGEIRIDGPIVVGETIRGHLRITASRDLEARGAALRLVGLRLVEERKSEQHETGSGDHKTTTTESWVEANGSLFETLAFGEPAIPSTMRAGDTFECDFLLPAPRLGPPVAHLGEAIVAWALEARWDVAMGEDPWVATGLHIEQNPDLIAAGVGRQGGLSMLDEVTLAEGATIGVANPKPVATGSPIRVTVAWPGAPDGDARIELHRRISAPNGVEGVLASVATTGAALRSGLTADLDGLAAGSPPSFDGANLENTYIVRVLIDRRFRTDLAIERPIAVI